MRADTRNLRWFAECTPHTSTYKTTEDSIKDYQGWFDDFRKRTAIHSDVRRGEAVGLDVKAAEIYSKTFAEEDTSPCKSSTVTEQGFPGGRCRKVLT